jgi:excisionase family DNA binding protein
VVDKYQGFRQTVAMIINEHVVGSGDGKLLRIGEAAHRLGVSPRTVWRMIADGQLTPVRFRRCTRLALAQIVSCLQGGGKVGGL